MGRRGKTRRIACFGCDTRAEMTEPAAARAGWELWFGGAMCGPCRKKSELPPAPLPPRKPITTTMVRCESCGREPLRGVEMTPGEFWPTFHWLATEENKRARRENKIPIPLCDGIHRAGGIVSITEGEGDD